MKETNYEKKEESNDLSSLMSLQDGIFSLTKTSIGVGIIMLPLAIALAGIIPGMFILVAAGIFSTFSLYLLSRLYELGDVNDYISLGRRCFGLWGELFILFFQLIVLISPLTAFVKFNGIFMSGIFEYFGYGENAILSSPSWMTIATSILFIFPLSLVRDLCKLSFSSALGLIGVMYLVILTVLDYFVDFVSGNGYVASIENLSFWQDSKIKMITTANALLLSYFNQTSMLPIISSLRSPTESRKNTLIIVSQVIVMLFYSLVALFGYLHFGDYIKNYENLIMAKDTIPYIICRIMIIVVIVVTYPLILLPVRLSADWIYIKIINGNRNEIGKSYTRHVLYAIFFISLSVFLSIIFVSIFDIFDVFMPFAGSVLMFIFPSVCFLVYRHSLAATHLDIILAVITLSVGVAFFFIGGPFCLMKFFKD